MCGELCTDNRFEIIAAYKKKLIDCTNIESSPEEMAVIDNILFRFWQMDWLPPIPHGRLIDADSFSEEMRKRHKAASDWYDSVEDNEMLARAESTMMAFTECRLTLDAMQTVIEAEDGDGNV